MPTPSIARRSSSSAPRRSAGSPAATVRTRSRSGSAPLAGALEGGAAAVAELVARGVVEGGYDPATIYREGYDDGPPALDELILVAPGEDAAALAKAAERGPIIGEGANIARTLSNRAPTT